MEDERAARHYLLELLDEHPQVQVVAAVANRAEAEQALASALEFDAVFMDIHLSGSHSPQQAGLEIIRHFRSYPNAPLFVLATALPQHAIEAYQLGITDYLLKPFTDERVAQCIQRLLERTQRDVRRASPRRLVARTGQGLIFFDIDEVLAIQADARLAYVHARGERYDIDVTLAAVERGFQHAFWRVHRNWLVNRSHVRALDKRDGELQLRVGELVVPVARDRGPNVRKALLAGTLGIRG